MELQIGEFVAIKQTISELENSLVNLKQQYEEEILRLRRKLEGKSSPVNTPGSPTGFKPTQPQKKQKLEETGFKQNSFNFPSLAQHSLSQNPNLVPMEKKQEPISTVVPPFSQILEEKEEKKKEEEKQEKQQVGNDWVVVYNPQVKTNVNTNLLHNLDHQSVVCCVKFSRDGNYLATGSNRAAQIFNVETGQKVRSFPAETKKKVSNEKDDSYVRSVCFSPDGQYLVAGAEDRTVKIWDIQTGNLKHSLVGHELDIYSLDFSSDNKFIVSGSGDGKVKLWEMATGKCVYTLGNEDVGPKEGVTSVSLSPDGKIVAAGSLDCAVRLWDTQTGNFICALKGHEDSVYSVAFSPDGKTLASGSLDKTLKLWDVSSSVKTPKCVSTLTGHRDYVLSVAFSTDGKWLISGSKDRSVQFWDPRSTILHLMLQGHKNSVISVALNPKQNIFATGSGDCRARIWKFDHTNV